MNKKLKVNLLGLATISFWALAFPFSKVAMQHWPLPGLGHYLATHLYHETDLLS